MIYKYKKRPQIYYKTFLLVLSFLFFSDFAYSQEVTQEEERGNSGYAIRDLPRLIHYIDGVQVTIEIVEEKLANDELAGVSAGCLDSKNAIQYYGEKYRYGVVFWDSKENDKIRGKDEEKVQSK